jgi:hypothetical protein
MEPPRLLRIHSESGFNLQPQLRGFESRKSADVKTPAIWGFTWYGKYRSRRTWHDQQPRFLAMNGFQPTQPPRNPRTDMQRFMGQPAEGIRSIRVWGGHGSACVWSRKCPSRSRRFSGQHGQPRSGRKETTALSASSFVKPPWLENPQELNKAQRDLVWPSAARWV